MIRIAALGWKMRRHLPGWNSPDRSLAANDGSRMVALLGPQNRAPATPIQLAVLAALKETGRVSLPALVKQIAGELYRAELRQGAAALDIGLFGERLFHRDVLEQLEAGKGIFWEITSQREARS